MDANIVYAYEIYDILYEKILIFLQPMRCTRQTWRDTVNRRCAWS